MRHNNTHVTTPEPAAGVCGVGCTQQRGVPRVLLT